MDQNGLCWDELSELSKLSEYLGALNFHTFQGRPVMQGRIPR